MPDLVSESSQFFMPNSAASSLVLSPYSEPTVVSTARDALKRVGGRASCAFVFCSADYREQLSDFLELVQLHAHAPIVAGCSGSGLIGTATEAEGATGFSLLLLHLPDTRIHAFQFSAAEAQGFSEREVSSKASGVLSAGAEAWVLLANPLVTPVEAWLDEWNAAFPSVPCVGGLASGGSRGDDVFLCADREIVEGAVAIGLSGGVRVGTLVSQGCRPVGQPWPITGAEHNFVLSLGSRPAYEVLQETYSTLSVADKTRARGNLFVGLAMSEYIEEFKTGDFLVRNLLGADPAHGVLAIGAHPRVGQTLQFQLRDGHSADAELRHLAAQKAEQGVKPFASLLFACNGRGRNLFGTPGHDATVLAETFGAAPAAGFFCNGELGPVGGKNFVHGYTASAALFSDP